MREAFLILLFGFSSAIAQLPGDFNCNGVVNGVDVTRYVQETTCCIFNPIDTSSCFWRNGDVNSDNLFCSNADVLQIYWYFKGYNYNNNPPLPGVVDTIKIGNVTGSPGSTVDLPLYLCTAELLGSAELNIVFDNIYLHNPTLIPAAPFEFGRNTPICDTNIVILGVGADTIPLGNNLLGIIRFNIDENAPIGERISVGLQSGMYFPSGYTAISFPAYFIRPKLQSGSILINQSSINERNLTEVLSLSVYPNPFNGSTRIGFSIAKVSDVKIEIFDVLGRVVDTPVDCHFSAGNHSTIWNSNGYSSGIYFCKFASDTQSICQRITIVK